MNLKSSHSDKCEALFLNEQKLINNYSEMFIQLETNIKNTWKIRNLVFHTTSAEMKER